ncbi:MAG: hypothetical protein Crog4KO_30470 [Crocinitomicaceae bacterium]
MSFLQTAERVSQNDESDNFVFQRSVLAYQEAADRIQGKVLEIGTGSGYGIEYIAQNSSRFITLDKHKPDVVSNETLISASNVQFLQMKVPPLVDIPSNYFDAVISFQVIEHIKDDHAFILEALRVLKPGGKLILTTPNKTMSLTRNPWHIREYTSTEFVELLSKYFDINEELGVFGNRNVKDYYEKNKAAVKKTTRFDILNLQYRLPRWMLQIPYDILNRMNRKRLLKNNERLTRSIRLDDYYLADAAADCFDLFFVCSKPI